MLCPQRKAYCKDEIFLWTKERTWSLITCSTSLYKAGRLENGLESSKLSTILDFGIDQYGIYMKIWRTRNIWENNFIIRYASEWERSIKIIKMNTISNVRLFNVNNINNIVINLINIKITPKSSSIEKL